MIGLYYFSKNVYQWSRQRYSMKALEGHFHVKFQVKFHLNFRVKFHSKFHMNIHLKFHLKMALQSFRSILIFDYNASSIQRSEYLYSEIQGSNFDQGSQPWPEHKQRCRGACHFTLG